MRRDVARVPGRLNELTGSREIAIAMYDAQLTVRYAPMDYDRWYSQRVRFCGGAVKN
jgi:hypothetical protein